jgi:hypothetical protein
MTSFVAGPWLLWNIRLREEDGIECGIAFTETDNEVKEGVSQMPMPSD